MIRIQFFARYREALGTDGESLEWSADLSRVEDIRQRLSSRGGVWLVLGDTGLMCARNDELCGLDEPIADGDQVAFFPTVTGG
ncbi:MoaD/ThiS family protein [Stutzerimonas tarimensis]|uniref:MoaD/ThiS family protein n=1 Tax=Stutzerimonas tarimensis TaxID=1507735 RepID=A0ABV7T0I5_9GAMM